MKTLLTLMMVLAITQFARSDNEIDVYGNAPEPKGTTPGRFQLFMGLAPSLKDDIKATFRIDTATGQVWMLSMIPTHTTGTVCMQYWDQMMERDSKILAGVFASLLKK